MDNGVLGSGRVGGGGDDASVGNASPGHRAALNRFVRLIGLKPPLLGYFTRR